MTSSRVNSIAELEALYGTPAETSLAKELSALNEPYRQLIEASPFLSIASIGPEGMDCSPRGDKNGFVSILDDQTIAIPDRRGNNRLDTLRNIVVDPRVALLFMIPGCNETLRVNGHAHLSVEEEILALFDVNGKLPATAIVVSIDKIYFQCARALIRSFLWDSSRHVERSTLPTAGELVRSAITEFDSGSYDAALRERQAKTLY